MSQANFFFPVSRVVECPRPYLDPTVLPVRDVLDRLPARALKCLADAGISICMLGAGKRYCDASAAVGRLDVDVDHWPNPPAGLFVVEERTVYLRLVSSMTIAHELGHALDCALGGGVYRSSYDAEIQSAFSDAKEFVTPYAAIGVDEYFAESFRAYVEINDSSCPWPPVSLQRLQHYSSQMVAWFDREVGQKKRVAA